MARGSLPPGFRFHPTDIELVMYYLKRKVMMKKFHLEAIAELNIYKFSPWDLPDKSCLKAKDLEWYFFCPRERKYASGARMNRGTETGYWKTTGRDRAVSYNDRVVGKVRTLVFHEGAAPHGKRTDWVIHEYRLEDKCLADAGVVQDSFVLCKVFQKSGPGPKNGAQYGAPFIEEEWDDDDSFTSTLPSYPLSQVGHALPDFKHCFASTSMAVPRMGGIPLLDVTAESKIQSSSNNLHPNGHNYYVADMFDPGNVSARSLTDVSVTPNVNNEFTGDADPIAHLLSALFEDNALPIYENCDIQELDGGQVAGCGSLNGLHAVHNQSNLLSQDDKSYFELDDLDAPVSPVASIGSQLFLDDLYEPCTPFGPEQNWFSCMSNSDNRYSRIGQSLFGPQPSSPIWRDLPVLSNSSDGLVDSHTAIGYDNKGFSSSNQATRE